ncbi:uncharacterized protein LOC119371404, partial [Jatropha curcas]|uniref:uncharacterized protein LOC119371404 n=1 Tax=Jatropha curcas TaxID=180498 RepID=UPI00189566AC
YFTKWIEAASHSALNAKKAAQFVRTNILCQYGTPFEIITDNGSHFQSEFSNLLKETKIRHHKSSPYRPQTNGAVEAANKAIKVILQKTVKKHKAWHEQLMNSYTNAYGDIGLRIRTPPESKRLYSWYIRLEAVNCLLTLEVHRQDKKVRSVRQIGRRIIICNFWVWMKSGCKQSTKLKSTRDEWHGILTRRSKTENSKKVVWF